MNEQDRNMNMYRHMGKLESLLIVANAALTQMDGAFTALGYTDEAEQAANMNEWVIRTINKVRREVQSAADSD